MKGTRRRRLPECAVVGHAGTTATRAFVEGVYIVPKRVSHVGAFDHPFAAAEVAKSGIVAIVEFRLVGEKLFLIWCDCHGFDKMN